jgi:hypothetical protein
VTLPTEPEALTMHKATQALVDRFMSQPSSDLRRLCEIAVMDGDPGLPWGDDGRMRLTANQARCAVAAVISVLALHEKVPNEVITW